MALAAEPLVASVPGIIEVEEDISPISYAHSFCQRAVQTWNIVEPGAEAGCEDTTTCLQGSSQNVRERSAALLSMPLAAQAHVLKKQHTPVAEFFVAHHSPLPYSDLYHDFLTVQRE